MNHRSDSVAAARKVKTVTLVKRAGPLLFPPDLRRNVFEDYREDYARSPEFGDMLVSSPHSPSGEVYLRRQRG
jgi:hypothetical protein